MMMIIQPHWHLPPDPHVKDAFFFFFFFNTLTKYYTRFLSFFVRRKSQLSVCSCRLLTKAACQQFACRGLSGLLDMTVVQSGGTASAAISNNRRSRTPSLWEVTLTSFCTSRCEAGGLRLSLLHCFKDKRQMAPFELQICPLVY